MSNPLITLAMPVYNVEKYVQRALLSALDQTYDNIEVLIIDDKGSDNSMNIVLSIKQNHPRGNTIRIIEHPHNIGTGGTKNTAIQDAYGEYLFFMDSDDTIEPNAIQILYNTSSKTNADVVMASCQDVRGEKVGRKYVYPNTVINGDWAIAKWMEQTGFLYAIPTWNKLYKLSILKDNNVTCVPHHRNEDTLFTFKTVFYVKKIATIPDVLYNYHYNESSTVHQSINDYYYHQYIEIFDERFKVIRECEEDIPPIVFSYFYQPFYESFLPYILHSNLSVNQKRFFINKLSEVNFGKFVIISFVRKDYNLIRWMLKHNSIETISIYYRLRKYLLRLKIL